MPEFSLAETIKQCQDAFGENHRKRKYLDDRIAFREAQIERLRSRKSKIKCLSWLDLMLKPLAAEISKRFPGSTYQLLGPFGIGATVAIWIQEGGTEVENIVFSLRVQPGTLSSEQSSSYMPLTALDYSVDTGDCPKGTIGYLNDMHRPNVPIEHMTVDEIIEWGQGMMARCKKQSEAGKD